MKPKLILLTGPAAGEVAQVFRSLVNGDAFRYVTGNGGGKQWDEVRDYWAAPTQLAPSPLRATPASSLRLATRMMEGRIRALPGGEAWLVGLVLPVCPIAYGRQSLTPWHYAQITKMDLPARLAILAPEPPPLLVERVRAWGGEVWECTTDHPPHSLHGKKPCGITARNTGFGDTFWDGPAWPEAVRAALGEVAP